MIQDGVGQMCGRNSTFREKFFRRAVSSSSRSLPTNSQAKGLRSKRRISLVFSTHFHSYQPSFAIIATINNLHWERSKLTLIYRIITIHLLHPPFHYFSANVLTVSIFISDKIKCSPSRKINKVVTKARREISRQEQIYIHIFIVVSFDWTKPFPACEKILSHSPLALRSEISRELTHLTL
jgi:hypothetical protein